ncbi:DeoR/GlpR family DNA-binding transcription regulator [Solicola gregarius]|uniref:DeoR/GlpR family DNA-binding transcription regulator n=1 Tax=Solicola gregarius TaxID=2908642 RepID=A0AA46TGX6_9ACTN|nr:DeoR/GlpR family DNA-binding transcription regulator [Solicola gregarius]UYM05152.1 DeoR/GlpR family DNA-binding transcription regulator [Solicola gregarius]
MFAAERQRVILDHVRERGAVSIKDLAALVGSSEVTVRRDLKQLEAAGELRREHGGAVPAAEQPPREPTYAEKSRTASRQKSAIARLAAGFVQDGDAIVIGAGTTTMALAEQLRTRNELTVMTNSLLVAQAFADSPRIEVVLTGGMLRGSIFAVVGSAAERALSGLHADRTFLSGNGLTARNGLSTPNQMVAGVDRALAEAGNEVCVLADHTKIGRNSVIQTVPTEQIDALVTDALASGDELDLFRTAGARVHVAT